jgi:hypothetical protein
MPLKRFKRNFRAILSNEPLDEDLFDEGQVIPLAALFFAGIWVLRISALDLPDSFLGSIWREILGVRLLWADVVSQEF